MANDQDLNANPASTPQEETPKIKVLPTLTYYQRTYAGSCSNNDAKAVRLFKEFENYDKLQRLKQELYAISKSRVAEEVIARALGKTRKAKFGTYEKWALSVLIAANSKS